MLLYVDSPVRGVASVGTGSPVSRGAGTASTIVQANSPSVLIPSLMCCPSLKLSRGSYVSLLGSSMGCSLQQMREENRTQTRLPPRRYSSLFVRGILLIELLTHLYWCHHCTLRCTTYSTRCTDMRKSHGTVA